MNEVELKSEKDREHVQATIQRHADSKIRRYNMSNSMDMLRVCPRLAASPTLFDKVWRELTDAGSLVARDDGLVHAR